MLNELTSLRSYYVVSLFVILGFIYKKKITYDMEVSKTVRRKRD